MSPGDRRYTRTHEWVKMDGSEALVGITDHAQDALGDITFVELPATGRAVKQGQELGVIESVKAATDLFAPVSGTVSAVNGRLAGEPETVNNDPYGGGWMVRLAGVDAGQLGTLMTADEYDRTVGQ